MSIFSVRGPFYIEPTSYPKGKNIDDNSVKEFCNSINTIKDQFGIYVFAIKAGKGFTPYYIGKTNKTFEKECFQSHKLVIYNRVLQFGRGYPLMFFVINDSQKRTKKNKLLLNKIEKYLIKVAINKNIKLQNKTNIKRDDWSIKGVINSSQGQPSKESKNFKRCLGL